MNLFFNPASPYARKVVVVAHECGLNDRINRMPVGLSPVAPNSEVIADNPLGKIPALVLEDGSVLYDSRVICEYLDSTANGALFPVAGDARWIALRRQACADGICDAALLARYEGLIRPEEKRWVSWIDSQKNKFKRALASLEQDVGQFGDSVDIGTLSIAIALEYLDFRFADEMWREQCPGLAEWHVRFSVRQSLQLTSPHELVA